MKNFGKGMLLFAALAGGLASCSDESPWRGSDSEGRINLNFSSDARVMRQTRADDGVSPVVPEANLFSVQLVKSDKSFSQRWGSVEAFNREDAFPIGDYTLTASYGSLDEEGFTRPFYKGSTEVHVSPGATSTANVVATLANAMVSVRYSDDFKANFPAFSSSVQTTGHEKVVFAQNEDRPAYISPAHTKVNLTLTNNAGQQVTIQPAEFEAVARHHYVINIGVNAPASGDMQLTVEFDDDVVAETVNVSLGDDLFTAPAPSIKPLGFSDGDRIETIELSTIADKKAFDIFAFGGLKSVSLTVVNPDYTPAFGSTVELVNANNTTQQQLKNAGVDCAGLFRNVDKMAHVNVTDFIGNLPAGEYTIEVEAVDVLTRKSEPVQLKVKLDALQATLEAAGTAEFMGEDLSVDIETNNKDIKDKVTFEVQNASNQMVPATIKSVTQVSAPSGKPTRAGESYCFRYVLECERQAAESIEVRAHVGGINRTVNVPVGVPEYSFTVDAFARKVMLRVDSEDEEMATAIVNKIVMYNGSDLVPTNNIETSGRYITIYGLNPATTYSTLKAKVFSSEKAVPPFTTEAEAQVANGDFTQLNKTVTYTGINLGGPYRVTRLNSHQNTAIISYTEPTGWATVNTNTCWEGSKTQNTWFMVPSTFVSNRTVVLRSVGYNHSGTEPEMSGGAAETKWYCTNAPSISQLEKAAGELFLGSYSYDGTTENRSDGVDFTTRPTSLSFHFKYEPLSGSGESGEVYVRVLDSSGSVIAENTGYISESSEMTNYSLNIPGYSFGRKAAKIVLGFRSTKSGVVPSLHIPSGSELDEGNGLKETRNATNYKALATGSVLTIENVRLGYEAAKSTPNGKPAKKNRK